jgi:hypothetical protein
MKSAVLLLLLLHSLFWYAITGISVALNVIVLSHIYLDKIIYASISRSVFPTISYTQWENAVFNEI